MNFKTPEFLKKKITYCVVGTPIVLYLLLMVFPIWFGCVIPEDYCLTGSTKLVDVLTISAYLIPIILVIGAYNQWRMQKGTEVVANEAKQTIKELLEIINISYLMNSYKASPESNAEKFKEFKLLSEKILRSSLFIDECVAIDDFRSLLNEFNGLCWEVKDIGLEFDPVRNHREFKDKLSGKVGYIGSQGDAMVKILIPYSTYQKDFIFKTKK